MPPSPGSSPGSPANFSFEAIIREKQYNVSLINQSSVTTTKHAEVAELVDAPDLGSGAARCESSSLSFRTIILRRIDLLK